MFRAWYRVFDYSGRSTRWEYWSFYIGVAILITIVAIGMSDTPAEEMQSAVNDGSIAGAILILAFLIIPPMFPLCVRRFHDFGWSGWSILLLCVPILNIIISLMLAFRGPIAAAAEYAPQMAQPAAPPQIHIHNSTSANAADSIHTQTVNLNQIERLAELHSKGMLTAEEFAAAKTNLLPKV